MESTQTVTQGGAYSAHPYEPERLEKERVCVICGKLYKPVNLMQKTCSVECREKIHGASTKPKPEQSARRVARMKRRCVVCGTEFVTTSPAQKTCSALCGVERKRLRDNAAKRARKTKQRKADKAPVTFDKSGSFLPARADALPKRGGLPLYVSTTPNGAWQELKKAIDHIGIVSDFIQIDKLKSLIESIEKPS